MELATVLETNDRIVMALAKGLLKDAGIPFYVAGEDIGLRPGMSDALIHRSLELQVPLAFERRARLELRQLEV